MTLTRARFLAIATVLVWLIAYVAWTADWVIQPMPHLLERSLRRIPMCLLGVGLCLGIAASLSRSPLKPARVRVAIGIGLCLVAALAYSTAGIVVFSVIDPLWGTLSLRDMLASAIADAWVFLAWLALYFAIAADTEARDARVSLAEARTAELRARNQALAQQINPHFLFNALNAVSGLILEGDAVRAEAVTMNLALLLRRSLEGDLAEFVSLDEEIASLRHYLAIEEIRFEGRFRFLDEVPFEARRVAVPSLILQPLVENAIKHGVARSSGLVTLAITAQLLPDGLAIIVTDDGAAQAVAAPPAGVGIGIGQANTRRRASLLYGEAASLVCEQRGSSYHCVLTLPARGQRRC